jgi:hypothetical protein
VTTTSAAAALRGAAAATALACVGVALACGGSPSQTPQQAYAQCLHQRTHTQTDAELSKLDPPARTSAEEACVSLLPQGDPVRARVGMGRLQRWGACMREHGANVPDPGRAGSDMGIVLPNGLENTPEYKAAAQACQALNPLGLAKPGP